MIVGSGSLESGFRDLIESKKYRASIFLAGDVPHAVTLHMIDQADILLRTTRFDGDAISVREALFLGTPVIATDNGMRPEGIHLIGVGDKDGLAQKVSVIATAEKQQRIERTSDTSNITNIVRLYEELT